ncbi:MAG: Flp pilus assembly protein CpaB [Hyphomicrobiales bacterium]
MARSIATTAASSTRNRGVLMLALLFGILSAALMFAFLSSKDGGDDALDEDLGTGAGAETVVVVTRDVAAGERITSDMLTTKTIPAGALLPGRVTDISDVTNKVATAPLFAGEQVIAAKVTTYEGQNTLAFKVPEGMRALSLQVPHEAWIAAGLPQPGDRVDVMGLTTLMKTDPLTGEEKPDVVAGIIAQNVEVLAVSQTLVKTVPNTDLQKAQATGTPGAEGTAAADTVSSAPVVESDKDAETFEKSISITLALPPELAAKVAIIDAMDDTAGQYRLLPRQKGDDTPITGTQTWSLDEVFAPVK